MTDQQLAITRSKFATTGTINATHSTQVRESMQFLTLGALEQIAHADIKHISAYAEDEIQRRMACD
jgi:hypothetical protein